MPRTLSRMLVVLILCGAVVSIPARALAQGVTTASIAGVVKDASGAVLPGVTITAVHLPSDTTYSAITQGDGRFNIPGMRIGGPYTVSAVLQGFQTAEQREVMLSLGVTQDMTFTLGPAQVSESLVVTAESSPIFSSARTGAATAITRDELGDAADGLGPHQRPDAPDAAVWRHRELRGPGQPDEQHHGGRLVLQQLVRTRRPAGRPHQRRADLARGDRADPGVGGAV